MSSYSVPENIRCLKPKGTMVKAIHNKYYVYEHFHIKEDGKWKTKMGKLIGSIDPVLGYIPNDSFRKDEITTVDFGEYYLSYSLSINVLESLKQVFNIKDAYTIYFLSLIHFVNGFTYIKNIDALYKQSYLSVKYNTLSLSDKTISNLYDSLGRKQDKVNKFEDKLIEESSKQLAFDGHCIKSSSNENELSEQGNKANVFKDDQINVLMAYDINTSRPVLSRIYCGGTLDKVSVKDLIERKNLYSMLFIVDKGFYSKENISLFSSNDNHYIIPLWANHKSYKHIISRKTMEGLFVFERSKKRSTVEYHEETIDGKKVIFYRDLSQNALESTDYLSKVEQGKYTMESYIEKKDSFGSIVLESNLDKTPEEIYRLYKKRWVIETFYDYYKNRLDVNAIHLNDYYKTQGLSFIMLITSLIYSEVSKNLKEAKIKESVQTILLNARFLKLHKDYKGIWKVENINQKHLEIFQAFNLNVSLEANGIKEPN
jgi:transposase